MKKNHELENTGLASRSFAIIQIPKEIPEKLLFVLVRFGSEVDVNNEVSSVASVLKAMVVACLDGRGSLAIWIVGQDGKRTWIDAAVKVAFSRLNAKEFVLVDVIVKWRCNDGSTVFLACSRDSMRHDVLRARRGESD
jgi:hypothetical protein